MNENAIYIRNWVKLGILAGLVSSVLYPALIFLPLPDVIQVIFVMAWGPLLGLAGVGGYYFFKQRKNTISLTIAAVSQIIAGSLVTTMLLVQMAIGTTRPAVWDQSSKWVWRVVDHVQLGLDVAWDVFLFIALFCFALNMFNHPKFGKIFSIAGIITSVALIALNIATFPTPPGEAGLIDLGPLAGLFGLAITINLWIHYRWFKDKVLG